MPRAKWAGALGLTKAWTISADEGTLVVGAEVLVGPSNHGWSIQVVGEEILPGKHLIVPPPSQRESYNEQVRLYRQQLEEHRKAQVQHERQVALERAHVAASDNPLADLAMLTLALRSEPRGPAGVPPVPSAKRASLLRLLWMSVDRLTDEHPPILDRPAPPVPGWGEPSEPPVQPAADRGPTGRSSSSSFTKR